MYEISNFEKVSPLTPEQAREVYLPALNVVARIKEIREYAADMHPTTVIVGGTGIFTGENPITRRGLVKRAERHEEGTPLREALRAVLDSVRSSQSK